MSTRRGGRGGGRSREPLPRAVLVSKKLSWLLRHGAQEEGLVLQEGGYANAQDVLQNRKVRSLKVTLDEVREIVRDNDKQRFAMIPAASLNTATPSQQGGDGQVSAEPQTAREWLIRATQGHSIKVDDRNGESLLTPITLDTLPAQAIHGTTHAAWLLIVASGGLKPMGRNHVHFATGLPAGFASSRPDNDDNNNNNNDDTDGLAAAKATEKPAAVISGMRTSSTVLIFLDLARAIGEGGLQFGLSTNGVVLTTGNAQGIVPIEFFKRVEDRTGHGVLVEDGKILVDAPAAWGRKGHGKR